VLTDGGGESVVNDFRTEGVEVLSSFAAGILATGNFVFVWVVFVDDEFG
jgi:hypothetical protein